MAKKKNHSAIRMVFLVKIYKEYLVSSVLSDVAVFTIPF